jgi:Family of unknown function (DUF6335)
MARRKAAATRKKGSTRAKSRARSTARKSAARKKTAAVARTRRAARAGAARKARSAGKARRAVKAKKAGKASRPRQVSTAAKSARGPARAGTSARKTAARQAPRAKRTVALRKPPGLDRERRTIQGDEIVPTPPSSLNLDRSASAVRTGRRELRERLDEHTETSPALTAGDVDADWESAYSVGDEAPGGDNPTPDQDVVDDIGRAVGVQYEDNEELKGEAKISKRDKHRWELDPASAEDFNEH